MEGQSPLNHGEGEPGECREREGVRGREGKWGSERVR